MKGIFFLRVGLNSGLKILSKLCRREMDYYPGFAVPLIEPRQSKFSLIGFSGWKMSIGFS